MQKNTQKIILSIITVLSICAIALGGTFAYYSASISDSRNMTGSTYSLDVDLTMNTVKNYNLAPTVDSLIITFLNSSNSCAGADNSYGLCNVYQITLKNNATTSVTLTGNITTNSGTTYTTNHLKYQLYTLSGSNYINASDAGNLAYATNSINKFKLSNNDLTITLSGNQTKTYYLVLWLSDINANQLEDVSKKYAGTLEFTLNSGETLTANFTA